MHNATQLPHRRRPIYAMSLSITTARLSYQSPARLPAPTYHPPPPAPSLPPPPHPPKCRFFNRSSRQATAHSRPSGENALDNTRRRPETSPSSLLQRIPTVGTEEKRIKGIPKFKNQVFLVIYSNRKTILQQQKNFVNDFEKTEKKKRGAFSLEKAFLI